MPLDINPFLEDSSLTLLHWEFGKMLVRRGEVPEDDAPSVTLLGAKSLQAVEDGHSCLSLGGWANATSIGEERLSAVSPLTVNEWEELLERNPRLFSEDAGICKPFFYDREHKNLYLQKYYLAENHIAEFVREHLASTDDVVLDEALKEEIHRLSRLFANKDFDEDRQQQAVAMALTHRFSILTGGPGTGKTTTLASILVMELRKRHKISIALAAPTGKAFHQMKDSLNNELLNNLNEDPLITAETREKLKSLPASTVHRLLGMTEDGDMPYYNHANPLPYDLIVVDEASMVSLKMMEQLLDALKPESRLLLIGDQNQLASVEAGTVLGDFCSRCAVLNPPNLQEPSQGYVTRLVENHRLQNGNLPLKNFLEGMSGMNGTVSAENLKPQTDDLYNGVNPKFKAVSLQLSGTAKKRKDALMEQMRIMIDAMLRQIELPKHFSYYFGEDDTRNTKFSLENWKALRRRPGDDALTNNASQLPLALSWLYLENFRIICAVHDGLFGEKSFNSLMAEILDKKMGDNGIPVMILRNDTETKLFNGDVGIFWNKHVYFPKWELNEANHMIFNIKRNYLPHQLPDYTMAFAMTIHKSQGSGYDNVLMVLPEQDQRVVSRELIYTGISRTKNSFELWGDRAIFEAALDRPTCRWSGLPYLLA